MEEEELEQSKQMVLGMCMCQGCPSWVSCGEDVGYCHVLVDKSSCIENEAGCICRGCPVYGQMGLTQLYFCIRGSESSQRGVPRPVTADGTVPAMGDPVVTDPGMGDDAPDPSVHEFR